MNGDCRARLADQHREVNCDRNRDHFTKPHRVREWWHDSAAGKRVAVTIEWGPYWEDDPEPAP